MRLTRYTLWGNSNSYIEATPDGEWVRYAAVAHLVPVEEGELIPCDVAVAPGLIFGAGMPLSDVLAAIRFRKSQRPPAHFRHATLQRILPPEVLADTAELIARDVANLPPRRGEAGAMRVTIAQLEHIVRARLAEVGRS